MGLNKQHCTYIYNDQNLKVDGVQAFLAEELPNQRTKTKILTQTNTYASTM